MARGLWPKVDRGCRLRAYCSFKALALATIPVLMLFAAASAPAATYYVAKSGSNTNPGTFDQPWKTIGKAAKTLVAGDTVYIRAGVYKERVVPKNPGKLGKYIAYAAYPGERVTLDGSGQALPEWTGLFYMENTKYIRVSGLRIINSNRVGILADGSRQIIIEKNRTYKTAESGIAVWGCYDVLIDGNEVEFACNDGVGECITVCGTDTFEVSFNHVHHGGPGIVGGEGICAKDGSSNGKVYGNRVHHLNNVGIYVDAWDKHTFNIEVFSNSVHHCADNGLALASEMGGLLEQITVSNNIAYRNQFIGILLGNYGGEGIESHPMKDILIINNTFSRNGDEWGGGIAIDTPAVENVVVRNNIFSRNRSFQIVVDPSVPEQGYSVDHNLIDGFRGDEGELYGTAYVEGDPSFVNAAKGNFRLLEGSPAIDQGSPSSAPSVDFEGALRPSGPGVDMGAFEYAGS